MIIEKACGFSGCETILSRQNRHGYCVLHKWEAAENLKTKKDWRKRQDPRAASLRNRERQYGLVDGALEKMYADQGESCALCHDPIDLFSRNTHVDHNHACCPGYRSCGRCVRGILCRDCNRGLGAFRDDRDRLALAILYLSKDR